VQAGVWQVIAPAPVHIWLPVQSPLLAQMEVPPARLHAFWVWQVALVRAFTRQHTSPPEQSLVPMQVMGGAASAPPPASLPFMLPASGAVVVQLPVADWPQTPPAGRISQQNTWPALAQGLHCAFVVQDDGHAFAPLELPLPPLLLLPLPLLPPLPLPDPPPLSLSGTKGTSLELQAPRALAASAEAPRAMAKANLMTLTLAQAEEDSIKAGRWTVQGPPLEAEQFRMRDARGTLGARSSKGERQGVLPV
jgi:hypothetical protein